MLKWQERGGELRPVLDGVNVVWAPQSGSQDLFLTCPVFEALLEGPRGTGKTDALIMDFAQHVKQGFKAEWRGVLFRQTYKQLSDVVAKTKKWFPQMFPAATFNSSDYKWEWPTGEILFLRYIEREDDYWNYHGHNYPWIAFEELTTWPDDRCYKVMMSCCRSPHVNIPKKYRATTNPYGCVPYGEVLTESGWRDIRNVSSGDRVVSFNHKGVARLSEVLGRTEREHDGELLVRSGRGIHMEFTNNHRFPYITKDGNELRHFWELPGQANILGAVKGWRGKSLNKWTVPSSPYEGRKRRLKQPLTLSGCDYAAFMGWYLSEGSCVRRDKAVAIAQRIPQNRKKIASLLERIGFSFKVCSAQFYITSHEWCDYLRRFGHASDKYVPREILDAEEPVLRAFLETIVDGDGHWMRNGSFSYTSVSKQLRDDVAEVAVKLGYRVSHRQRLRENREKLTYELHASQARPIQLITGNHLYDVKSGCARVNVERKPYKGPVYCLRVEGDQSFIIRQGKNVWLSGNSGHNWVKARFELPLLPGETIGRVKDDRVAVHADLRENKVLLHADPGYIKRISMAARNPSELKAWLEGDWDIVAGGMFDDLWAPRWHVVPNFPFSHIPTTWRLNRSYDHGQSSPFSVGWWAESNGEPFTYEGRVIGTMPGDLVRLAEWYGWNGSPNEGLRMLSTDIADGIIERETDWGIRGRVLAGPSDTQIFSDYSPGKSVAGEMKKRGVRWTEADKRPGSRKQGWQQLRKLLRRAIPEEDGTRDEPGLFICRRCTNFIRTFPVLPRSDKDLDDADTDAEDHIADEVRYRVMEKRKAAKSRSW